MNHFLYYNLEKGFCISNFTFKIMTSRCSSSQIYQSQLNYENSSSTASLILICSLLPLQFLFLILIFRKGYKKYKKIVISRQAQSQAANKNKNTRIYTNKQTIEPQQRVIQFDQNRTKCQQNKNQQRQGTLFNFLYGNPSKLKVFAYSICFLLSILVSLALLLMTILSIYQAVDNNYLQAQCKLNNKLEQFKTGTENWIGLQKITPNITQLNLVLNTRIQVSINAIRGLVLNGTVAMIKPGLGFANNTNIQIIYQHSPLNRTNLTYNSIKSNINASVRYWLFMNSSLGGGTNFSVCQKNKTFPIQHPLNTNQTIELDYMDEICTKLTQQVDQLVENGGSVDQLLVDLQSTKSQKPSIQSNLSVLSSTYSPIASRSKQYTLQFSSFKFQYQFAYYLPMATFLIYSALSSIMLIYLMFNFWLLCCGCCRISCDCQQQQEQQEQEQEEQLRSKMQQRDQMNKNEETNNNRNKSEKLRQYKQVSFKYSKSLVTMLLVINTLVGVSCYLYSRQSVRMSELCFNFKRSLTETQFFNSLPLTQSQRQLLSPIHLCTSGKNQYFMESIPLLTSHASLQKLRELSSTFNSSVPKSVYEAESLKQVQKLKEYLFHLQSMPIKSTGFNLVQMLAQINALSNGSHPDSKQLTQCKKVVIQDEYVYNSIDCRHKVMDMVTELDVDQPRCIIIPTYDGTPGTSTTHLNEAQHTFVLNPTCPSINNMFSPGNASCFLNRRLALLNQLNCTNTAMQLGNKLQSLVKFSQQASSFTGIYIQNLRNVFGVYAVSSTNLTQFFAGSNMSQTLSPFGTLSHNLLNRTKCQDVKNKVDQVHNTICPKYNSISVLFADAYVWAIIVLSLVFVQSVAFYLIDMFLRVYRLNKFFGKVQVIGGCTKIRPIEFKRNANELSQQTLIRNLDSNGFQQNIQINLAGNNTHKGANDNIFNMIQDNGQQYERTHHKNILNKRSLNDSNADMMLLKDRSSPTKSINPYGNFSYSDQIVQYPKFFESGQKKKRQLQSNQFKQSIKQNPKQSTLPIINQPIIDPISDQENSEQQQQQNKQITDNSKPKVYQMFDQDLPKPSGPVKRKKIKNFHENQKKITPRLFFNLQSRQGQKITNQGQMMSKQRKIMTNQGQMMSKYGKITSKGKQANKKFQIKTQKYKDGQSSDDDSDDLEYIKEKQVYKVKSISDTQKANQSGPAKQIAKNRNYLQIHINEDQLGKQEDMVKRKNKNFFRLNPQKNKIQNKTAR